jgi:type II secretory pathway pseudopilin PulG
MISTRLHRSNLGFSLIEAMVVIFIIMMIGAAVGTLYYSSLQVWRRCSAQSQADPPAHLAVDRVAKELRNAYIVDSMGADNITFTLPAATMVTVDGVPLSINTLPLSPAKRISYYLSDDSGTVGQSGTVLWRKEVRLSSGTTRYMRIANNVEELLFTYDSTPTQVLKIYAMSITVLGQEGRQQYNSQFGSRIAFRNTAS